MSDDVVEDSNWLQDVVETQNKDRLHDIQLPQLDTGGFFDEDREEALNAVREVIPGFINNIEQGLNFMEEGSMREVSGTRFAVNTIKDEQGLFGYRLVSEDGQQEIVVSKDNMNRTIDTRVTNKQVCNTPPGTLLTRSIILNKSGTVKCESRSVELPLAGYSHLFPEWDFKPDDVLQLRSLVDFKVEKNILPVYLENEPDFDLSVSLQRNKAAYPSVILRANTQEKNKNGTYNMGSYTDAESVEDFTYKELVAKKIIETYSPQIVGKEVQVVN